MTIPLSVRLKFNRAQEHLDNLAGEIASYLDREPYKLVYNVQPSDQHLVLIEFHVVTKPDERLGIILGDYLHNLRSALDHLICRLVERTGGKVTQGTQFPIFDSPPKDRRGQRSPLRINGGVDPNVLALVESLQPYTRGEGALSHPLSILRHLSNADKHQLLHVVHAGLIGHGCRLHLPNGTVLDPEPGIGAAHHETPIAAFRFPEPFDVALYGKVQVEAGGSAFVALKEPEALEDRPVTELLDEISRFVWNTVIAGLHPFLD